MKSAENVVAIKKTKVYVEEKLSYLIIFLTFPEVWLLNDFNIYYFIAIANYFLKLEILNVKFETRCRTKNTLENRLKIRCLDTIVVTNFIKVFPHTFYLGRDFINCR